jgi:hypothetical protein
MLEFEASTSLPVEELKSFDNIENIKFIKRQKFHQNAVLNREKYELMFNRISDSTQQKIEALKSLSIDTLLSIIKERDVTFQFRNLKNLDENQVRDIIADLYMLDELKDEK